MTENVHKGSSFDSFLEEEGIRDEVDSIAVKRVLAWQLAEAMKIGKISKPKMAKLMETSRSQLDRVLDPTNDKVSLETMTKAANAVGRKLHIALG